MFQYSLDNCSSLPRNASIVALPLTTASPVGAHITRDVAHGFLLELTYLGTIAVPFRRGTSRLSDGHLLTPMAFRTPNCKLVGKFNGQSRYDNSRAEFGILPRLCDMRLWQGALFIPYRSLHSCR